MLHKSRFYTMNCECLFNDKNANVKMMADEYGDGTYIIGKRGKSNMILAGSGTGYNVEVGKRYSTTIDTGNGNRVAKDIEVINIITVEDGKHTAENDVLLNNKISPWCMK